jgi:hypothetical protein
MNITAAELFTVRPPTQPALESLFSSLAHVAGRLRFTVSVPHCRLGG